MRSSFFLMMMTRRRIMMISLLWSSVVNGEIGNARKFVSSSKQLNYSASLHENAVILSDEMRGVVTCLKEKDKISISVQGTATKLDALEKKLISSNPVLIGDCDNTEETGFYGHVLTTLRRSSRILIVEMNRADLSHVFSELKLHARLAPKPKLKGNSSQTAAVFREEPQSKFLGDWFDDFIDSVGDFIDTVGEALAPAIDFVSDIVQTVVEIAGAAGLIGDLEETLGEVAFNHDFDSNEAVEKHIALWDGYAFCEDCHVGARVVAGIDIEFSVTGGLELFQAYVEGLLNGEMHAKLNSTPALSRADMPWTDIDPFSIDADVLALSFSIGPVPVWIDVIARLEAAVENSGSFSGTAGVGAALTATTKLGVQFIANEVDAEKSGWGILNTGYFELAYTNPWWKIDATDAELQFHVSPQFVIALYDTIPIVLKAKPRINARLNSNDATCTEEADARYSLTWAVDAGVAIGDIQVPDSIPILGGTTLIGGRDFGEFAIVDEQTFPGCLDLCDGCLASYGSLELPDFIIDVINQGIEAIEEFLPGLDLNFVNWRRSIRGDIYISYIEQMSLADYYEWEAFRQSAEADNSASFSTLLATPTDISSSSSKKKSKSPLDGWHIYHIVLIAGAAALFGIILALSLAYFFCRKNWTPNTTPALPPWPISVAEKEELVGVPTTARPLNKEDIDGNPTADDEEDPVA